MAHSGKMDNLIFALDIGTRSVIGVVGALEGDVFKVRFVETVEHTRRAVVDGQIEDIEQTARVAGAVKDRLESKLGHPLEQVHVAAAGRVLRTKRITYEMEIDGRRPLDARQVFQLESGAIQSAYEAMLAEPMEGQDAAYYCVGHSVIQYALDGYTFSTLEGHRGKTARVELVATFLPNEVIESLYATMQRIGLTVASLTLEPIAAISAVIPGELRLLNIVLVDVGAGTSDIAVASGGSVSAYTMATMAGDEITERIMQELLVDFQMSEQVKFALSGGKDPIPYVDIFGTASEVAADTLFDRIQPAVDLLAKTISERVLDANGKPPMAIFMVGGGSRTPGLCPLVARHVGLDESKVAIGGSNYMKRLVEAEPSYVSAEFATPMGIAVAAANELEKGSFTVQLNGRPIHIQSSTNATVMEVLLRSGYQYGQIMGRSGHGITFELNGEKTTVRGALPTLAGIAVNGQAAGITTSLQAGDVIAFEPASDGADADTRLESVLGEYRPFSIIIDGEIKPAGTWVRINDMPAVDGQIIQHMDKVEVQSFFTLGDILSYTEYGARHGKIHLNGQSNLPLDAPIGPGDQIAFLTDGVEPLAIKQEESSQAAAVHIESEITEPYDDDVAVIQTLDELTLPGLPVGNPVFDVADAGTGLPPHHASGRSIRILLNGERTLLEPKQDGTDFYFFDVLGYTDIDPTDPQGEIVILRNGRGASYIEAIQEGDEIEIFWKVAASDVGSSGCS